MSLSPPESARVEQGAAFQCFPGQGQRRALSIHGVPRECSAAPCRCLRVVGAQSSARTLLPPAPTSTEFISMESPNTARPLQKEFLRANPSPYTWLRVDPTANSSPASSAPGMIPEETLRAQECLNLLGCVKSQLPLPAPLPGGICLPLPRISG